MKIKCNVIKDILPLYVEKIVSEDTNEKYVWMKINN